MMKKMLALALSMVLLLTGCASAPAADPQTTAATEVPTTEAIKPAAPTKRIKSVTTELYLGEIINITTAEFQYDEKGFLKELITSSNGTEISRSTYQCDDKGNPLKETNVSGGITTVTESQLTYDEAGNLTTKIDTVTRDGTVTDVREYHYTPYGKHTLVKFYRGGETEPYNTIAYEYNAQEQVVLEVAESNGETYRTETEYNDQGQAVRKVRKSDQGEILAIASISYEGDGKVVQTSTKPDGTVQWVVTQLEYQEGDTRIQESYTDGVLNSRVSSTYELLEG